ncbi:hypothetical protein IHE45_16G087900 [Dioscorea alata]|uniref:Uncharacterized protein n=1 Tax=Dioscorea alata TaxID=55571 RepID=A0ACB7UIT3_DIOAL|nr:hypothetical protein IHE45_16G087900 [Dioscorea alata]
MAKKKVVLKLSMNGAKEQSKAMSIVVGFSGIISAKIEGENNDQIMFIGDGIDPVNIAKALRKKFCYVVVISVSLMVEDKKKELDTKTETIFTPPMHPCNYPCMELVCYDTPQDPPCSIL